ncbi:MAG: hypothetical protein ACOYWZ_04465 [Bacillota bacterium]
MKFDLQLHYKEGIKIKKEELETISDVEITIRENKVYAFKEKRVILPMTIIHQIEMGENWLILTGKEEVTPLKIIDNVMTSEGKKYYYQIWYLTCKNIELPEKIWKANINIANRVINELSTR